MTSGFKCTGYSNILKPTHQLNETLRSQIYYYKRPQLTVNFTDVSTETAAFLYNNLLLSIATSRKEWKSVQQRPQLLAKRH